MNGPDTSSSSSLSPSCAAVTGCFGGEKAFFGTSLRVAMGDLTDAATVFLPARAALPPGDPFDCPVVEAVLDIALRGVPDARVRVPFAFEAPFSSVVFLATSGPVAEAGRRAAGTALFVSRCRSGFVAAPVVAVDLGLSTCASPGLSFFCKQCILKSETPHAISNGCTYLDRDPNDLIAILADGD